MIFIQIRTKQKQQNKIYQNYKILNKSDLDKAEIIISNAKFKSREDLYFLIKSNNLNPIIADYFIFYKKILGV